MNFFWKFLSQQRAFEKKQLLLGHSVHKFFRMNQSKDLSNINVFTGRSRPELKHSISLPVPGSSGPPPLIPAPPPPPSTSGPSSTISRREQLFGHLDDNESDTDHVIKPSDLIKKKEQGGVAKGTPVLPFVPPKFPHSGEDQSDLQNTLIKPSEYLKSITTNGTPATPPPVTGKPPSNRGLPVIHESAAPPPPPPPKTGTQTKATPASTISKEDKSSPLASMAISIKELQSVQLRKTEKVSKTMSAPIPGECTVENINYSLMSGCLI